MRLSSQDRFAGTKPVRRVRPSALTCGHLRVGRGLAQHDASTLQETGSSMGFFRRFRGFKACAFALLLLLAAPAARAHADDDVLLQGFWWDSPQDWWNKLRRNAYDFAKSGFR